MQKENPFIRLEEDSTVLPLLEDVISKLTESLDRYLQRPQASLYYVERQNEILSQLQDIHQVLHSVQYLSTWQYVEKIMKEVEGSDSEIGGHAIIIRTRERGRYHSHIDINWSTQENLAQQQIYKVG